MEESNKNGLDRSRSPLARNSRLGIRKLQMIFTETFGFGPGATLSAIILTALVLIVAVFWFFYSAPPNTINITSGDDGSLFRRNADKYAKILAREGVKLRILSSEGSLENLKRLADPTFHVDVGFVQTGMVAKGQNIDNLVSLGSLSYEPLYLFCQADKNFKLLSDFSGKRLAIGEKGTGTNVLALELLALNEIKTSDTTITLLEIDDEEAEKMLLEGKIDGAFMMGDSASSRTMRDLLKQPGITAFNFTQAD